MMEYENLDMKNASLSEDELREIWHQKYCTQEIFTFDGIKVKFYDDNFDHAFYESSGRNYKRKSKEDGYKDCLSTVRLEKMLWIKDALMDKDAELYIGFDKKTNSYNKSSRVAVVKGDYVVVIKIYKEKQAKFITAYVADNSIEKIKKSPMWRKKMDAD